MLSAVVLAIAIPYGLRIYRIIFLIFPIARVIQPIENFPYNCERVEHPLLEGCEDIWLDYQGRKLYAACSTIATRTGWSPGGDMFNVSARDQLDHISVMDIDEPGSDGLYGVRQLKIGATYKDSLDLHGFDVRRIGDQLRFWLINHRPPMNPETGVPLDAFKVGANSTIEIFDLNQATNTLEHLKTIASVAIVTPNGLAVDADGVGFAVTNDHTTKSGLYRALELLVGGGSVSYCNSDSGQCQIVTRENCNMANGIVNIGNGHFLVSQSGTGVVVAYQLQGEKMIQAGVLDLEVPLDNLSLDPEGNIFVAAFPNVRYLWEAMRNPYTFSSPAAAFKISPQALRAERQGDNEFPVLKLVEDRDGKKLPTTTVVVHDAKTNRLFLAGVTSPFIGVCMMRSL